MTVGVPVAAAAPVVEAICGPLRTATVLGVLSRAVVIDLGDRLLTLLGPGATAVPNGVRLPSGTLPTIAAGDRVTIGAGRIVLTSTVLTLVRSWRTAVPRVTPDPATLRRLAARVAATERGLPTPPVSALHAALDSGGLGIQDAVADLVGLGLGLTPAGDDVLCGVLVGLHATGRSSMAGTVAAATDGRSTTRLSADLLRLAADGQACLELLALLAALHRAPLAAPHRAPQARTDGDTVARADPTMDRLLAIGHTSGADLATGLLLVLGLPTTATAYTIGGKAA